MSTDAERANGESMRGPSIAIFASLVFGSAVYLARPSDPVVVGWAHDLGFETLARAAHDARLFVHGSLHLPAWFMGSASDAAFGFALGSCLARASFPILVAGMFVALGHEIAQGFSIVAGTFDPLDVLVLTVTYLAAVVFFRQTALITKPTFLLRRSAS